MSTSVELSIFGKPHLMRGYVSVDIPTKKYIRAYIVAQLGTPPVMNTEHVIGAKLFDLLEHPTNEDRKQFAQAQYNDVIRVKITHHAFVQRGCNLNETNVKNFNLFVKHLIKDKMRFLLDFYIEQTGSFTTALELIREKHLLISEDDWETETIKKDYWRYRKRSGSPLLYRKNIPEKSLIQTT